MKKVFCIVLLALGFQAAQGQTTTAPTVARPVVNRNDDAILVALTDSPEATWRKLAQVLVQRGYSIEHSDQSLLTLSTHPFGQSSFPVRVTGMVLEQTLILRMYEWNVAAFGAVGASPVRRRGDYTGWRELEAIAQEMGTVVRYTASNTILN